MNEAIREIAQNFCFEGELEKVTTVEIGLINSSFILQYNDHGKTDRYLLQKINSFVFKKPQNVMDNIVAVTEYINSKQKSDNTYDYSKSINVIPTKTGFPIYISEKNEYYRAYNYIESTYSIDAVRSRTDAYNAGKAFGEFIYQLKDFDSGKLHVTIPDFHNTKKRYENYLKAVKDDSFNRVNDVKDEIETIEKIKDDVFIITEKIEEGTIPERIIHNDTKINNILFDSDTDEVVCVVDLDTVMPGSFLHDFGDAITTGAVKEENGKLVLDLEFYEYYVKGYLTSCADMLTNAEIELMPIAAKTLAFEVMTRFLADYLCGDVYFRTEYEGQNLDRTRQEISLVIDIIKKIDDMKKITKKCAGEIKK